MMTKADFEAALRRRAVPPRFGRAYAAGWDAALLWPRGDELTIDPNFYRRPEYRRWWEAGRGDCLRGTAEGRAP
jgi:hypothetical protein